MMHYHSIRTSMLYKLFTKTTLLFNIGIFSPFRTFSWVIIHNNCSDFKQPMSNHNLKLLMKITYVVVVIYC